MFETLLADISVYYHWLAQLKLLGWKWEGDIKSSRYVFLEVLAKISIT